MDQKQHDEWVDSVTRAWPEPRAETTSDAAWRAYHAAERRKTRARVEQGLEQIIDGLSTAFRAERRKQHAEFEALSLELHQQVLATSKEIAAELATLKRAKQDLHEQQLEAEAATRQLRLVASGRP